MNDEQEEPALVARPSQPGECAAPPSWPPDRDATRPVGGGSDKRPDAEHPGLTRDPRWRAVHRLWRGHGVGQERPGRRLGDAGAGPPSGARRAHSDRSAPVSLVILDGARYIVSGEGMEWVKNARAAGWVTLERARRRERVVLTPIGAPRSHS